MSEKRKFTLPSALQVKNRRKTISAEEKLDVRSKLGKGERIIDKYCKVKLLTYTVKLNSLILA